MRFVKWLVLALLLGTGSPAMASSSCTPTPPPLHYPTSHFTIAYAVSGVDAVSSSDSGQPATLMDGTVLGVVSGGDGIPDYVQLIGTYLEYAWSIYQQAGLRLPDRPVAVSLLSGLGAYGLYLPSCGEIYLENDLVNPGTTAVHELFHAVQYQYWSADDFADIPADEQAFYKEATADWAMIEIMKPQPYVSWFADPDRVSLFSAGSSAAFFWIYYLEQLSAWRSGDALPPGFDAMKAWLERVGTEEYDLAEALRVGPEDVGLTWDELMEQFTLANLLETPLKSVQKDVRKTVKKYVYKYEQQYGFNNSIAVKPISADSIDETAGGREVELEGALTHQYAAAYYQLDASLLGSGCQTATLKISGSAGLKAYLVQLRGGSDSFHAPRLSIISTFTDAQVNGRLCASSTQKSWLVVYAASSSMVSYALELTLSP